MVFCCAGSVKQAALRGECLSYFVFSKGPYVCSAY